MRNKLEELIPQEWLGKNRKAELIEILLPLFSFSNCECKNLPKGEVAISSKAMTDPNWKG